MSGVHPHLSGFEESLTGFCAGITSDHAYIHQGLAFSLPFNTGSLNAAASYKLSLMTPGAGTYIHFRPAVFASTANHATMKIYEGSVNSDGTAVWPFNRNRNSTNVSAVTCKAGVTATLPGITGLTATAGGGFTNQPAGDALEILSDNAADIAPLSITIYGTKTGATTTVTTETIALDAEDGTTAVTTTTTTWQNVLAVEMSGDHAGTITVREASGNQTVTTMATGTNSAGIVAATFANARETIPRHDASGASTAPIALLGTAPGGATLSVVDALNGATEEDHGTTIYSTVSRVLLGAVASDVNVNIVYPEKILDQFSAGSAGTSSKSGGGGGADLEIILKPSTEYVIYIENTGASTATTVTGELFWYEESAT